MKHRRMEALRNLAARPGTPQEGEVARAMLAKLEAKHVETPFDEVLSDYLRGGNVNDYIDRLRRERRSWQMPVDWRCSCGAVIPIERKCDHQFRHLEIQTEIRAKFAKGDRIFYNRWAYSLNCVGTVMGYVKLQPENGDFPWAWLRVKFEHLKQARNIPIYSAKGWHLSKEPVAEERAQWLAGP